MIGRRLDIGRLLIDDSEALGVPPSQLARTFGLNVRRERERQRLTMRELGRACDMDGAAISRVENAERDLRLST